MSFIFTAAMHEKRVCPKCGNVVVVPVNKKHEKVTCKHCGASIPPIKSG